MHLNMVLFKQINFQTDDNLENKNLAQLNISKQVLTPIIPKCD